MELNRDEIIRLEIEDEEDEANKSLFERIFFCFSNKGKSEQRIAELRKKQ